MATDIGREVVLEALSNHYKELNAPRYIGSMKDGECQEQPPQFKRFVKRSDKDNEIIITDGNGRELTILIINSRTPTHHTSPVPPKDFKVQMPDCPQCSRKMLYIDQEEYQFACKCDYCDIIDWFCMSCNMEKSICVCKDSEEGS